MKRTVAAIALLAWAAAAPATEAGISIDGAWISEAPPGAAVHAGYLRIANDTAADVTLTEVSSPAFARIEMHRSVIEDGVARMEPQDGIPVPAGGAVELKPGDLHLMLFKPSRRPRAGDGIPLSLHFDDGRTVSASAEVRRAAGAGHAHH